MLARAAGIGPRRCALAVHLRKHSYTLTDRGPQTQNGGGLHRTWRVDLLDENGKITDIWSECWTTAGGGWRCSYMNIETLGEADAILWCFRSMLEYLGIDEA